MSQTSQDERVEIYEGWISFALHVIHRGFELAELPGAFTWKPTFQFILHESSGMGTSVVFRAQRVFGWPEGPTSK